MTPTLNDIGEFGFIDRIAPLGLIRPEGVIKGIGDDCAVIAIGGDEYLLVTTDMFVEKVHFLMEWTTPEVIGAKVLTTNISDIAACGGIPRDAFISLAIPEHLDLAWLDDFYRGMSDLAREFSVNLLGGDTTRSKRDVMVNIALTGLVPSSQVLFRHTARPGDLIVLTGPTGESAAGLDILLKGSHLPDDTARGLIRAHLEPRAHVREGRILAESAACDAAIDVSDGVSSDLGHICRDSGLAAVVWEECLPMSERLLEAAAEFGKDPLEWVLNGGEDYVLLAAVRRECLSDLEDKFRDQDLDLFVIGELREGAGMELVKKDGSKTALNPSGWNHFK
jgi:thiamine-monophosphate kinase